MASEFNTNIPNEKNIYIKVYNHFIIKMGTYDYKAKILFFSDKQKEDFLEDFEVFKEECWDVKWKNAGDLGWVLVISADDVCYINTIELEFRDVCKKYGVTADINYDTSYSNVDGGGFAKILPTGYILLDDLGEDELKIQYFLHCGPDMAKEDILTILQFGHILSPYKYEDIDKLIIENKEAWVKRVEEYVNSMRIGDDGPKLIERITSCYSETIEYVKD